MLENEPSLLQNLVENLGIHNNQNYIEEFNYNLKSMVFVAQLNDEVEDIQTIPLNQLQREASKMINQEIKQNQSNQQKQVDSITNQVLNVLLKNTDYKPQQNSTFPISKETIALLCDCLIQNLKMTKPVVFIKPSVKIFGDLFGQYFDLLNLFRKFGVPEETMIGSDIECMDYLFLGNYVDLGMFSLEVIILLFGLKLKYKSLITLLRGAHENALLNKVRGLGAECEIRLQENIGSPKSIFNKINEVFSYLPLAAVLNQKIFCIHSGIGQNLKRLEQIYGIKFPIQLSEDFQNSENQILKDILFSSPNPIQ